MSNFAYWAAFAVGLLTGMAFTCYDRPGRPAKTYTVEAFTESLTLRLQCAGACNPAALKAEVAEWLESPTEPVPEARNP